jgi:hypothetical protein
MHQLRRKFLACGAGSNLLPEVDLGGVGNMDRFVMGALCGLPQLVVTGLPPVIRLKKERKRGKKNISHQNNLGKILRRHRNIPEHH